MKLTSYLKDRFFLIVISFFTFTFVLFLLILFNSSNALIHFIMFVLIISYFIVIMFDYFRKRIFYNNFKKTITSLDKKYLVTEIIKDSSFLEGQLLLEYLYEIDKSMHEEINNYKYNINEFREYIELWCHEIKTPIATSKLIIDNNLNNSTISILEEMNKIESFIEQVLFYARSGTLEEDYIITDVSLKKVINNILKKNKKDLISKNIKIDISELPIVKSDYKWLEFIINQIIVNSIKYSKNKKSFIKIYSKINKNNSILFVEDNGIGIEASDIDKVFLKGYTGINGRKQYNSTGMGLYLCKKLCNKLNHEINISSIVNKKTVVAIIFPNSSMLNLTNM